MDTKGFKIGDRVRLKGSHYCGISGSDTGKVGEQLLFNFMKG